ncbi:MAG: twin-arginine translocase subunit TatC [Candidatus Omnitrophica bacterium]|nr:twin-arginine translocase subunit TatC [Candidatus Omnitrophota bacterium]
MIQDSGLNFTDHLDELRKRFLIALFAVGLSAVMSFFFSNVLIQLLTAPIEKYVDHLYFLSPYEAFLMKLKISLVSGIILSSPILFSQLWHFVSPGLYASEKRIVLPLILISTALFILGVLFAYFLVVPISLSFFLGFQTPSLVPLISIGSYVSFLLSLILVFGIVFDFPVLLVGLISLNVVSTSFLKAQRKTAVILLLILAAVLTPTVDIFTQLLLAIPLWGLFELSILIGGWLKQ